MATQVRRRAQKAPKRPNQSAPRLPVSRSVTTPDHSPAFGSLLYTSPSLLTGLASVLDLGGTLFNFNYSLTPGQADYLALLSDHHAILSDWNAAAV
jgi:hypothetical protein